MDEKTAVITGAGSGIGRAIALKFAANGAKVHILDVNQKDANNVASEICQAGGSAMAYACDVTNQAEVGARFREISQRGPIQILVNNAGVSHIGNVESTTETDFDRVMRVNVKGYYNCIQACVGHMKPHGGVILNMASVAGSAGLATAIYERIIPGGSRKCMTSWRRLNPLGEWESRRKWPRWHYFCVQMRLRSLLE